MSDDLVKRLRESRTMWENARGVPSDLEREAADTIAALTARAERAEAEYALWKDRANDRLKQAHKWQARAHRAEAALATARGDALEVAASKCDDAAAYRVKQINQLSGVLDDEEIHQKTRWRAGKIQAEILARTIRAMKGDTA